MPARAIDEDTIVMERVGGENNVVVCVVRLRGHGHVEYLPSLGASAGVWLILCSTEERQYACHPQPIDWQIDGDRHQFAFQRPGAVLIFRDTASHPAGVGTSVATADGHEYHIRSGTVHPARPDPRRR